MLEHLQTFTTSKLKELLEAKLKLEELDPGGNHVRTQTIQLITEELKRRE